MNKEYTTSVSEPRPSVIYCASPSFQPLSNPTLRANCSSVLKWTYLVVSLAPYTRVPGEEILNMLQPHNHIRHLWLINFFHSPSASGTVGLSKLKKMSFQATLSCKYREFILVNLTCSQFYTSRGLERRLLRSACECCRWLSVPITFGIKGRKSLPLFPDHRRCWKRCPFTRKYLSQLIISLKTHVQQSFLYLQHTRQQLSLDGFSNCVAVLALGSDTPVSWARRFNECSLLWAG
jgi:hypothetical protein